MKSFNQLTKQEKKEYLAILLLLPFAYIGHLFRKANFRTLPRSAVAIGLSIVMIITMLPIMSVPANAAEYSGGTVQTFNLKKGDVIHAGVTVTGYPDLPFRVYRTPGPNEPISAHSIAVNVESWTADKNYYVVWDGDSTHLLVYPTSDITFYPSGGTAGGTTAPSTFLAVEETDRYWDVSWLTPYRPGCTFLGWYTSDGTEQVYNANGKAVNGTYWKNNLWQGQGAKSFIAKWKPNTSVTFRYFPNGGTGQPDNFVQWTANATYFDTYSSDSHWNYTTGTYKLSRVGYTATGNYAKKDGSCVVHEDHTFTSYPQLCAAYGLNPDTCGNATVDIYAQWAPINYTVTFNGNGATGGSMANQSFVYDTPQALKPNAFERVYTVTYNENGGGELPDGKAVATFNGWQDRGSIVYKDGTTYTFADFDGAGYGLRNNDVFVSSAFGNGIFNKYGLLDHYVIHGKGEYADGSASRAPTTDKPYGYPNGATVSNLSTTGGATVPLYALWTPGSVILPTPTKAGHTFNGWYTDATGGTKVGGAGASYTPAANTTLYAQWTANTYTVSFNANGGSVGTPSKTVTYDSTYGDLPEPTKKGYIFDGWYTNQNFETKVTRITEVQITENQTLYAKWRPNTYQANLYANGGSVSPTSIIVTYDSPYGTLPTPTRTGYTFNGWFTQSSGGDRVESTTVVKTASTHSLCAQWDANTYTVNFNANGGSVGTPSKTVTYDSTYGELPTPTRENHTFTGWFTAAEGGTQITSTTAVKITESQTLYARWNINTYTVTWKNHDSSVLETDMGVVHGTTPTYNGATPQKAEDENFTYTFDGWSPAVSAITDDTEYIAQFTAVSKRVEPTYTVTIPATVNEGESFTVKATEVVLNTDQTLTVTLQSDFKFKNEQGAELDFTINDGAIANNAQLISVTGNGDKNNPLAKDSDPLTAAVTEEAKYSGTYTGTLIFTIAVNTAEQTQ